MKPNYYQILGVGISATDDEIKKAFRSLATTLHPDKNNGDPASAEKFKLVNEAYSTLSDKDKKAAYDRQFHRPIPDPDRIWDDILRPFSQSARNATGIHVEFVSPGADVTQDLSISFVESFTGTKKPISVTTYEACGPCSGTGAKPGSRIVSCGTCGGSGVMNPMFDPVMRKCITCHGMKTKALDPCLSCRGKKSVSVSKQVLVAIPKSVKSGDTLRIPGKGKPGDPPGDLFIRVIVTPSKDMHREDNNVVIEYEVPLDIMILGGTLEIHTPWDKSYSVDIPENSKSGSTVYIDKAGFKTGDDIGKIILSIVPKIPAIKTDRAKKLFTEFMEEVRQDGL